LCSLLASLKDTDHQLFEHSSLLKASGIGGVSSNISCRSGLQKGFNITIESLQPINGVISHFGFKHCKFQEDVRLDSIFWVNIGKYVYNWDCIGIVQDEKNMKVFKVTGQINKPRLSTPFVRELLADKSEHAVEKVYAEIGSRHRVKRMHIKIISAEEISAEAIENPILKKLVTGE